MIERTITTDDNVKLYCRISGRGKPLLLIHGAMVDADFFEEIQQLLSCKYRVISYDRRGYSRSDKGEGYLTERQAKDAQCVLKALTNQKAIVVGCSAGGLVALKLKELYPELVSYLFVHEPPIITYEGVMDENVKTWLSDIEGFTKAGKIKKAILAFIFPNAQKPDPRTKTLPMETVQRQLDNGKIFIEREFPEQFDINARPIDYNKLKSEKNIIVLVGDSSGEDSYCARAAIALAEDLDTSLYYVPGTHNGARDLPFEFSATILGLLDIRQGD